MRWSTYRKGGCKNGRTGQEYTKSGIEAGNRKGWFPLINVRIVLEYMRQDIKLRGLEDVKNEVYKQSEIVTCHGHFFKIISSSKHTRMNVNK